MSSENSNLRKIIHIDMDCFYAAVEIRDNPQLRNKPVAVGGISEKRGVLCTCNYEARKYGVKSAMPTWKALNQCPNLILLPVNMPKYKAVSQSIYQIFKKYTSIVEPLSLDEAFLDVSASLEFNGSATLIAQSIREEIFKQEHLTASAGISFNKFLAKIASEWNKPNGQYVIKPEHTERFMAKLSVEKIHGVGRVTAKKLHNIGAITCKDLQAFTIDALVNIFGKYGRELYYLCRGIDHRKVEVERPIKSLSVEETYNHDLQNIEECRIELLTLYNKLLIRLETHSHQFGSSFVKLKFNNFTQTTIERKTSNITLEHFDFLLQEAVKRKSLPIRLIGIGVRFIKEGSSNQLKFEIEQNKQ